jgi:methyltransferase (TIGR00027 family)
VLADWLGWPLVGANADTVLANLRNMLGDDEVPFLTFVAARSRIAEDWLVASGAKQYVILGAGLDSFAWRQSGTVDVFEVDHPSTQTWKRARIAVLGLPTPAHLAWVPVDFEVQSLGASLAQSALNESRGVFVSWLGVTPYLTADAIATTLRELPPCSLAVGYVPCEAERDVDARKHCATLEAHVRELGEPWIMLPTREEFAGLLAANGFEVLEDVGAHDLARRYGLPMVNYERMALARKPSSAA